MRNHTPRAVADLLVSAMPQLSDPLVEYRLRRSWDELVGPDIARRARPRSFADGCVTIVVDNSPWLQELTLRADALTTRLRARVEAVRSIRLVLGSLDVPTARSASQRGGR